jgi:TP901 family phage tail tape measure protein
MAGTTGERWLMNVTVNYRELSKLTTAARAIDQAAKQVQSLRTMMDRTLSDAGTGVERYGKRNISMIKQMQKEMAALKRQVSAQGGGGNMMTLPKGKQRNRYLADTLGISQKEVAKAIKASTRGGASGGGLPYGIKGSKQVDRTALLASAMRQQTSTLKGAIEALPEKIATAMTSQMNQYTRALRDLSRDKQPQKVGQRRMENAAQIQRMRHTDPKTGGVGSRSPGAATPLDNAKLQRTITADWRRVAREQLKITSPTIAGTKASIDSLQPQLERTVGPVVAKAITSRLHAENQRAARPVDAKRDNTQRERDRLTSAARVEMVRRMVSDPESAQALQRTAKRKMGARRDRAHPEVAADKASEQILSLLGNTGGVSAAATNQRGRNDAGFPVRALGKVQRFIEHSRLTGVSPFDDYGKKQIDLMLTDAMKAQHEIIRGKGKYPVPNNRTQVQRGIPGFATVKTAVDDDATLTQQRDAALQEAIEARTNKLRRGLTKLYATQHPKDDVRVREADVEQQVVAQDAAIKAAAKEDLARAQRTAGDKTAAGRGAFKKALPPKMRAFFDQAAKRPAPAGSDDPQFHAKEFGLFVQEQFRDAFPAGDVGAGNKSQVKPWLRKHVPQAGGAMTLQDQYATQTGVHVKPEKLDTMAKSLNVYAKRLQAAAAQDAGDLGDQRMAAKGTGKATGIRQAIAQNILALNRNTQALLGRKGGGRGGSSVSDNELGMAAATKDSDHRPLLYQDKMRKLVDRLGYDKAGQHVAAESQVAQEKFDDRTRPMSTGAKSRQAMGKVAMWGSSAVILYGGIQKLREGIGTIVAFEKAMISVQKVMSPLGRNMGQISKAVRQMSNEFGGSIVTTGQAMEIFAQQGMNQHQALAQTRTSLLATNVTTMALGESTEYLTAAVRQFGLGAGQSMRVLDAWNEVENNTAVTAKVLAESLKHAGTIARAVGVDFDAFNGIVAAVGESTRKSGQAIGASLKFIFQRIRSDKAIETLQQVGVSSVSTTGKMRSGKGVLSDLSKRWSTLTDIQKQHVAVSIAGTRRLNDFFVLMGNWDRGMDVASLSLNSQGSAMRENAIAMESFSKKAEQLRATYQSMWVAVGNAGALKILKTMADTVGTLAKGFETLNKASGGFVGSLGGLAGTAALGGGAMMGARYLGGMAGGYMPGYRDPKESALRNEILMKEQGQRAALGGLQAEGYVPRGNKAAMQKLQAGRQVAGNEMGMAAGGGKQGGGRDGYIMGPRGRTMRHMVALMATQMAGHAVGKLSGREERRAAGKAPTVLDTGTDVATSAISAGILAKMAKGGGGKGGKALAYTIAALTAVQIVGTISEHLKAGKKADVAAAETQQASLLDMGWQAQQGQELLRRYGAVQGGRATGGERSMNLGEVIRLKTIVGALASESAKYNKEGVLTLANMGAMSDEFATIRKTVRSQVGSVSLSKANAFLGQESTQTAIVARDAAVKAMREATTDQDRLAKSAEVTAQDAKIAPLLDHLRANTSAVGSRQAGLGETFSDENITKWAKALSLTNEETQRGLLEGVLSASAGQAVNIAQLLKDAGLSNLGDRENVYVQHKREGQLFNIRGGGNPLEAGAAPQGATVLKPYKQVEGSPLTTAKQLQDVVKAYTQAVQRLVGQNDQLIGSIKNVNATMTNSLWAPAAGTAAGGQAQLDAAMRLAARLTTINGQGRGGIGSLADAQGDGEDGLAGRIRAMAGAALGAGATGGGMGLSGLVQSLRDSQDNGKILREVTDKYIETFRKQALNPEAKGDFNTKNVEATFETEGGGVANAYIKQLNTILGDRASQVAGLKSNIQESVTAGDTAKRDELLARLDNTLKVSLRDYLKTGEVTNKLRGAIDKLQKETQQGTRQAAQGLGPIYHRFRRGGGSQGEFAGTAAFAEVRKNIIDPLLKEQQTALVGAQGAVSDKQGVIQSLEAAQATATTTQRTQDLARELGTARAELIGLKDNLITVQKGADDLSRAQGGLLDRLEQTTVGARKMQESFTLLQQAAKATGQLGGLTGLSADNKALEVLQGRKGALDTKIAGTTNPDEAGFLQKQATKIAKAIETRKLTIRSIEQRRRIGREALPQAAMINQVMARMGLARGDQSAGALASQRISAFSEAIQQAVASAMAANPTMSSGEQSQLAEKMVAATGEYGRHIQRLTTLMDTNYQKEYLLASDSRRGFMDSIREALASGSSVEEIMGDPMMRRAMQQDPQLFSSLFQKSLDQPVFKELQKQTGQQDEQHKALLGKLNEVIASVGGTPMRSGSMASPPAGGAAVDAKGRIAADGVPAQLHKGEIVLNAQQAKAFLENKYADGTLPDSLRNVISGTGNPRVVESSKQNLALLKGGRKLFLEEQAARLGYTPEQIKYLSLQKTTKLSNVIPKGSGIRTGNLLASWSAPQFGPLTDVHSPLGKMRMGGLRIGKVPTYPGPGGGVVEGAAGLFAHESSHLSLETLQRLGNKSFTPGAAGPQLSFTSGQAGWLEMARNYTGNGEEALARPFNQIARQGDKSQLILNRRLANYMATSKNPTIQAAMKQHLGTLGDDAAAYLRSSATPRSFTSGGRSIGAAGYGGMGGQQGGLALNETLAYYNQMVASGAKPDPKLGKFLSKALTLREARQAMIQGGGVGTYAELESAFARDQARLARSLKTSTRGGIVSTADEIVSGVELAAQPGRVAPSQGGLLGRLNMRGQNAKAAKAAQEAAGRGFFGSQLDKGKGAVSNWWQAKKAAKIAKQAAAAKQGGGLLGKVGRGVKGKAGPLAVAASVAYIAKGQDWLGDELHGQVDPYVQDVFSATPAWMAMRGHGYSGFNLTRQVGRLGGAGLRGGGRALGAGGRALMHAKNPLLKGIGSKVATAGFDVHRAGEGVGATMKTLKNARATAKAIKHAKQATAAAQKATTAARLAKAAGPARAVSRAMQVRKTAQAIKAAKIAKNARAAAAALQGGSKAGGVAVRGASKGLGKLAAGGELYLAMETGIRVGRYAGKGLAALGVDAYEGTDDAGEELQSTFAIPIDALVGQFSDDADTAFDYDMKGRRVAGRTLGIRGNQPNPNWRAPGDRDRSVWDSQETSKYIAATMATMVGRKEGHQIMTFQASQGMLDRNRQAKALFEASVLGLGLPVLGSDNGGGGGGDSFAALDRQLAAGNQWQAETGMALAQAKQAGRTGEVTELQRKLEENIPQLQRLVKFRNSVSGDRTSAQQMEILATLLPSDQYTQAMGAGGRIAGNRMRELFGVEVSRENLAAAALRSDPGVTVGELLGHFGLNDPSAKGGWLEKELRYGYHDRKAGETTQEVNAAQASAWEDVGLDLGIATNMTRADQEDLYAHPEWKSPLQLLRTDDKALSQLTSDNRYVAWLKERWGGLAMDADAYQQIHGDIMTTGFGHQQTLGAIPAYTTGTDPAALTEAIVAAQAWRNRSLGEIGDLQEQYDGFGARARDIMPAAAKLATLMPGDPYHVKGWFAHGEKLTPDHVIEDPWSPTRFSNGGVLALHPPHAILQGHVDGIDEQIQDAIAKQAKWEEADALKHLSEAVGGQYGKAQGMARKGNPPAVEYSLLKPQLQALYAGGSKTDGYNSEWWTNALHGIDPALLQGYVEWRKMQQMQAAGPRGAGSDDVEADIARYKTLIRGMTAVTDAETGWSTTSMELLARTEKGFDLHADPAMIRRHAGGPVVAGSEAIISTGSVGAEIVTDSNWQLRIQEAVRSAVADMVLTPQTDSLAMTAADSVAAGAIRLEGTITHSGEVVLNMDSDVRDLLAQVVNLLNNQTGGASVKLGDLLDSPGAV